jgi:hypothetical protein
LDFILTQEEVMGDMRRRSHAEWCALIQEQRSGEQTVLAFCRERTLAISAFHYHKRKMREDATAHGFRELTLPGRSGVRLILEAGTWQVDVQRGFDTTCLREVLRALA